MGLRTGWVGRYLRLGGYLGIVGLLASCTRPKANDDSNATLDADGSTTTRSGVDSNGASTTPDGGSRDSGRAGCDHYVAPEGNGSGTQSDPWNLTRLAAKESVAVGATVCLLGGEYGTGGRDQFVFGTSGEPGSPVTIRPAGDHVAINGSVKIAADWVVVRDLEIMNSHPERQSEVDQDQPPPIGIQRLEGLIIEGTGVSAIHNIVHDTGTYGIHLVNAGETAVANATIYGNLIFNNGWDGPAHGHGRGIRGGGTDVVIADNVLWNNFAFSMDLDELEGRAEVDGNVALGQPLRVLGPASDLSFRDNAMYGALQLGHVGRANGSLTAQRNVVAIREGNAMRIWNWGGMQVFQQNEVHVASGGNIFLEYSEESLAASPRGSDWGDNRYWWGGSHAMPFRVMDQAGIAARYPWTGAPGFRELKPDRAPAAGGTETIYLGGNATPSDNVVRYRPSAHENRRGLVVVYNWKRDPRVELDLSSLGFSEGEPYEIRNVQNLCGDEPVVGTYQPSQALFVPMSGWTTREPIGYDASTTAHPDIIKPTTFPQFGVFLVTSGRPGSFCLGR